MIIRLESLYRRLGKVDLCSVVCVTVKVCCRREKLNDIKMRSELYLRTKGIRAKMSMNKTLHVLNRTLDTVFQKQPGDFLGVVLDEGKAADIEHKMKEYEGELAVLKGHVRVFQTIMRGHEQNSRWPAVGDGIGEGTRKLYKAHILQIFGDLLQNVNILSYNFKHAIRKLMKFQKTYGSRFGPAPKPSVRIVEDTRKSTVNAEFQILRDRTTSLRYQLIQETAIGRLPLGDTSAFSESIDRLDRHIEALRHKFLEVCHQGEDELELWEGAEPGEGRD